MGSARSRPDPCEHTFLTAQPHAHVRFRRAIERRALWLAEDAARELPNLPLEDALQLVHLYFERGSPKAEPAARRWLVRYLGEGTPSLRDVAKVDGESGGARGQATLSPGEALALRAPSETGTVSIRPGLATTPRGNGDQPRSSEQELRVLLGFHAARVPAASCRQARGGSCRTTLRHLYKFDPLGSRDEAASAGPRRSRGLSGSGRGTQDG